MKAITYFASSLLFILIVAFAYLVLSRTAVFGIVPTQKTLHTDQDRLPSCNYLLNSNFEEGFDDFAAGWTYRNDSSTKIFRVNSQVYEGNYSYYIWTNTSGTIAYSEYFNIIPDSYYNVSFSTKTMFSIPETAPGYYLELLAKNSAMENTVQTSTFIKETTNWTRYEYNCHIPEDDNYTKARLRFTMLLASNADIGYGASAWIDEVVVKPQIRSIICSQPFLLDYEKFPSTLNFSAQFINCTAKPLLNISDFTVKLDELNLTARSVEYNETTQLYDISVSLPPLQKGKYTLKLLFGSQESVNFKGVNVYQYTGNFSFIHWTDLHYDPPNSGYENQLNATIQLLKRANPDFILMTGDMASSEANYQRFYTIMRSMDFNIPVFFTNGNHEKESIAELENAVLYMGEKKTQFGTEHPFTFNYGHYHFIGLDSGKFPYSSRGSMTNIQINWLKNDLKRNQDKLLVTFCHHPLYFSGRTMFWSESTTAKNIMALFSNYGVIATFAGHAHKSNISEKGKTIYYTTVSGHNDTRWVGDEPYPPSGFRTIKIVNNVIVSAPITNLFSYYTGSSVNDEINKSH